jgi:dolichyl-phosphate beta-glucosyltransferase
MSKTISFVVPVYNEEKRLIKTATALRNAVIPEFLNLQKIIFVDDGSTDATLKLLYKFSEQIEDDTQAEVEVVSYKKNRGKGYAIKTGMAYSDSDYTLFFDADIATPLVELEKFVPFMKDNRPVIIGTRKNGESTVVKHQPRHRELLGRAYTLLSKLILNTWATDFTCGFKAFSREARVDVFSRSVIDRWGYDSEILYLARKLGYNIVEKAVIWSDDSDTKVKLSKAMFTSLAELLKIRLYDITGRYEFGYARKLASRFGFAGN